MSIRASFNYVVDTGVQPVYYIDWPEMEHKTVPLQLQPYEMAVRNGRPLRASFDLDTHGFAFVEHHTRAGDFADAVERSRIYEPEVQALVRQCSGAAEVMVFDHTVRMSDVEGQGKLNTRPTVKRVHNDYSDTAALRRLRELLGAREAASRIRKRWAIIQIWRPLRDVVLCDPLGICDGRSISPQACIPVERRHKDHVNEVCYFRHDPGHAWYYFPRMERNEALVFKVFDSDTGQPARFTAHSAFDDPTTPADAPARASIETRTFVFFD